MMVVLWMCWVFGVIILVAVHNFFCNILHISSS
jgi:hypothetical protein